MPADIAPSPITQITLLSRPIISRATAMPRPAEIEVDEWAAPSQDFVRIALVADIPDQAVAGGIEDVVQCNRQFDDAEAGTQMPTGLGYRVDEILPQLIGNFAQSVRFEPAQVFRSADLIEKWSFGWFVQRTSSLPTHKVDHGTHSQGGDEGRDTRRHRTGLKPPCEKKQFT